MVANVHSLGQEFLYFKDTHRLPLPEKETVGTSLAVQWLRFRASNAEGTGSITGWGPKIPHAARRDQKLRKKKKKKEKTVR